MNSKMSFFLPAWSFGLHLRNSRRIQGIFVMLESNLLLRVIIVDGQGGKIV